jgi:hypothetical protein
MFARSMQYIMLQCIDSFRAKVVEHPLFLFRVWNRSTNGQLVIMHNSTKTHSARLQ